MFIAARTQIIVLHVSTNCHRYVILTGFSVRYSMSDFTFQKVDFSFSFLAVVITFISANVILLWRYALKQHIFWINESLRFLTQGGERWAYKLQDCQTVDLSLITESCVWLSLGNKSTLVKLSPVTKLSLLSETQPFPNLN